jgi:predicted PurR-regulated permease PerM
MPCLGGILSAATAVLLGLLQKPVLALYVSGLYLLAHAVEAYIVAPLVQQRQVHLPPVFTLIAQILLGSAAGLLGLMLATPLVALLVVIVKMLYIEDMLGEKAGEKTQ